MCYCSIMSDNIKDAHMAVLIKIQSELSSLRKEVREGFAHSDEIARKNRRDVAGMMVIGKAMAGDFAEQMAAVVERVEALEAKRS